MCGPATVPITLRLDAEVPERLDQAGRDPLLAGGVRARLLGARARQQAAGVGQPPDEVGVVGDRRRGGGPAASAARRSAAPASAWAPPAICSSLAGALVEAAASSPRRLRLGARLDRAPRTPSCDGATRPRSAQSCARRLDVRRAHDQLARARARAGSATAGERSSSRLRQARGCARRGGAGARSLSRSRAPCASCRATPLPVARSTLASEAPVSRITPASSRKTTRMSDADVLDEPVRSAGRAPRRRRRRGSAGAPSSTPSRRDAGRGAQPERAGGERERDRGEQADGAACAAGAAPGSTGRSSSAPPPSASATGVEHARAAEQPAERDGEAVPRTAAGRPGRRP